MKRLAAIVIVAACGTDHGIVGDPFPIGVDLSTGPLLAEIAEGDEPTQLAVIDLMAPITVIDADEDRAALRRFADLTLLGRDLAGDPVPRAHLRLTITELHPCPTGEPCRIGAEPGQIIDAVIGADAFDSGAVRVDFAHQELRLFPDIAGEGAARGRLCEAVFAHPFEGGGELSIADTRVGFPPRRVAIDACLHFDETLDADNAVDGGADVLLVMSTGIGPTILSETAYERFRAAGGTDASGGPAPEIASLGKATVFLPSGPIEGSATTIDRMALVGSDNEVRGPCRQVYTHHLLSDRSCEASDVDCPCGDGDFCRAPAIVELTGAIDVLVVADDDATLQALRLELRPGRPEVDGILGTAALASTSFDLDTPHDRVLVRCESGTGCRVRPELITEDVRGLIAGCLARAEGDVDGGMPDAAP